jgi:hypothetical protein
MAVTNKLTKAERLRDLKESKRIILAALRQAARQ